MHGEQGTPRVLLIEHNPWIRADLVSQLAHAGYSVRTASNGFSGLRLAHGVVPGVVVLGTALPDVPAYEVREQLGSDCGTRAVPLIPLTLKAGNVSRLVATKMRRALDAGFA